MPGHGDMNGNTRGMNGDRAIDHRLVCSANEYANHRGGDTCKRQQERSSRAK